MLRSIFLVGSTGFWLTMMSLLIQREFFQLTPVSATHEILPLHNLYLREEYRAVYSGAEMIGFNFNVLEPLEDKTQGYQQRHQTYLTFLFLGQEREMLVKGQAELDPQLYLKAFEFRISSGDYWTRLEGQIAKGNLNLVIDGKEGEPVRKIIPLQAPILLSETLNFIWTPENLKLGKQGQVKLWNPLLLNFQDVNFRVIRRENIETEGRTVESFVIQVNQSGAESYLWVSPEGVVLREQSPTGLILRKKEAWKIFDTLRKKSGSLADLPNLYSIPSNQNLGNPTALTYLKARLRRPEGEKIIENHLEDLSGLDAVKMPVTVDSADPVLAAALAPDTWVQADDPAIKAKAAEIAGGETSAMGAALAVLRWVHKNVQPAPTVSIPSARDVLAIKKGDCNEYTVLFTALLRALGIPAKMKAGLVYQNERFFYHAWADVYLGKWVAMDPTFGEVPVNVTHIPLTEGSFEEQNELIHQLGKISVTVLEKR